LRADFRDLADVCAERAPEGARGVLLDLGLSSMQIDTADRGFSYQKDGPLDMRMDPDLPEGAADLLARVSRDELRRLLAELGEILRPGRVAGAILRERDRGALSGTADLRRAVERAVDPRRVTGELARVFQALRIRVNAEDEALAAALAALPDALAPGGVAVVISYHSLEDRPVKRFFRHESTDCVCPPGIPVCVCGHRARFELLTPRALRPGAEELSANPRARSARLRAARRLQA
jgi:16S rRNA (cytosine1402-N4)-methyltransferase